jgi:hypothetical protein
MSEQPVQFSGEQAGETPVTSQSAAPTKNLTEADVKRIIGDAVSELNRQQQGLAKKRENRILSEVTKRLEAVRQSGVEMNPQQQQALQQATANQVIRELDEPGETEPEHQPAKVKQPTTRSEIEVIQQELAEEYGVFVTPQDPEANGLDMSSPRKFLKSYEDALKAKVARSSPAATSTPQARMPTGGGGATVGLQEEYESKLKTLGRGKVNQIVALRDEYRKKGLPI